MPSINMITIVTCRPSVCLLPAVWGHGTALPLTSTSQWKGQGAPAVGSGAEQQVEEQTTAVVRALGRLGGYKTPLEQPRQARCQVNSSGDSGWPATAMRLQGHALNYVHVMLPDPGKQLRRSRQGSRLPPRISVAFATGRKQNIARRSDRHTANTLGLQTMEQSRE